MTGTVFITGASSGIGAACARHFLDRGWNVVATMRSPDAVSLPSSPRLLPVRLDVTDKATITAAVQTALESFGAIDVLVNNAGYGPLGTIEEFPRAEMDRLFATNVFGPIDVARQILPHMRTRQRGRIINVTSMGGEFTTPFGGMYHASKYALESISDALRFEVADFGIQVVVVQPGPVKTPMADNALATLTGDAASPYRKRLDGFAEMSRDQMKKGTGMLAPEAVAKAIFTAATTVRPKTRYKVGMMAHVMPGLRRWLSDRWWDGMWRSMLPKAPKAAR